MNVTRAVEDVQVIYFARGGQITHVVPDSLRYFLPVYVSINNTKIITTLYYWTRENLCLALPQVTSIATESKK
jgi:hypothetical protein